MDDGYVWANRVRDVDGRGAADDLELRDVGRDLLRQVLAEARRRGGRVLDLAVLVVAELVVQVARVARFECDVILSVDDHEVEGVAGAAGGELRGLSGCRIVEPLAPGSVDVEPAGRRRLGAEHPFE